MAQVESFRPFDAAEALESLCDSVRTPHAVKNAVQDISSFAKSLALGFDNTTQCKPFIDLVNHIERYIKTVSEWSKFKRYVQRRTIIRELAKHRQNLFQLFVVVIVTNHLASLAQPSAPSELAPEHPDRPSANNQEHLLPPVTTPDSMRSRRMYGDQGNGTLATSTAQLGKRPSRWLRQFLRNDVELGVIKRALALSVDEIVEYLDDLGFLGDSFSLNFGDLRTYAKTETFAKLCRVRYRDEQFVQAVKDVLSKDKNMKHLVESSSQSSIRLREPAETSPLGSEMTVTPEIQESERETGQDEAARVHASCSHGPNIAPMAKRVVHDCQTPITGTQDT